jgi:hypothetical protein
MPVNQSFTRILAGAFRRLAQNLGLAYRDRRQVAASRRAEAPGDTTTAFG